MDLDFHQTPSPPISPPQGGGDDFRFPKYEKLSGAGKGRPKYPDEFEEFWKVNEQGPKKPAYERWAMKVNGGIDRFELLNAYKAYVKDCRVKDRRYQDASTFLGPKKSTWSDWLGKTPDDVSDRPNGGEESLLEYKRRKDRDRDLDRRRNE